MKKRYGKFNYKDFVGSYIVIAIMLLFTIISLFLELNIYICLVWLIDPIFRIYFISKPFRESFKLSENRIIIYKGKKEIERIILPNQYSLIVSYVDIKPTLFSYRTPIGNETHILKNKYAVSIIQNASIEEIEAAGLSAYYTDHGVDVYPVSAAGVPFTAAYIAAKGDAIANLQEDLAAEQKARATYEKLIDLCKDDSDVVDVLRYLRQREIVHFQRFGEALNSVQEKLYQKNKHFMNSCNN